MSPALLADSLLSEPPGKSFSFLAICTVIKYVINHERLRLMSFSSSILLLSHFLLFMVALERVLQAFWRMCYGELERGDIFNLDIIGYIYVGHSHF